MEGISAAIAAHLAGHSLRCNVLVGFDFKSGWRGYWPGFGPIEVDDRRYSGLGELGSISSVTAGSAGAVEEMTFTLAASVEALQNLQADEDETRGQEVTAALQFFDEAWAPSGLPLILFVGRMGGLKVSRPASSSGDRPVISLSVAAQNAFVNRGRPPFAFFSDRDQKSRSTGDNMFVRVSELSEGSVAWPKFSL